MIEKNDFPLLGPKAGGTKFNLGPAFYYMEYLSALIFGNNPAGIATFIVILSILSIPLFYYFFRFFFQRNICLILTFLYAISFYAIKYSKFAFRFLAMTLMSIIITTRNYNIFIVPENRRINQPGLPIQQV